MDRREVVDGWTFDVRTGVWMNADETLDVVERAEVLGRKKLKLMHCYGGQRRGETITVASMPPLPADMLNPGASTKLPDIHVEQLRINEYGFAVSVTDPRWRITLAYRLACVMDHVDIWTQAPHLRRGDESVWLCSCGTEFFMPADCGRQDFGRRQHLEDFPSHRVEFVLRPGKWIAFYGLGGSRSGAEPSTKPTF